MSVSVLSKNDFIREHGLYFYNRYPTEQAVIDDLNTKIDAKINNSPPRIDTSVYHDHRDLFIETIVNHFYRDKGYLHFLSFFYDKKLSVNPNSVYKAMKKQGLGIKFIPGSKTENGNPQFKNAGGDEGRRLITNLSYKEVFTCKKGKPVDILTWDALNNALDLKHAMRPAFWKNVTEGDFDGPGGQEKAFDVVMKIISMFCDKASIFNPKVYATIMNHYAPAAEKSLHLVGSWCTPALAAASLYRLKHQVIIDVIPRQKLVGEYINGTFLPPSLVSPKPKLDFIICPSEQLDSRLGFSEKYKDYFDIQIFSPVYYDTEMYNSVDGDAGEQSIDSFPDYPSWIEGYFHQTIQTAFKAMKPGSVFIIVISDFEYDDPKTKETYYISRDMLDITGRYFDHVETADLILTTGSGFTNKKQKEKRREGRKLLFSEHVHVFRKPVKGD